MIDIFKLYTLESVHKQALKELQTHGAGHVRATDAVVTTIMSKPKDEPFPLKSIEIYAGNKYAVVRTMACVTGTNGTDRHGRTATLTRTMSPFESGSTACPTTCRRLKSFCIANARVRMNEDNLRRKAQSA